MCNGVLCCVMWYSIPVCDGVLCCVMWYSISMCDGVLCCVMWYWAVQAGLLTPLTFAQHRLSPLAAFTSGVYFLHNGRQ